MPSLMPPQSLLAWLVDPTGARHLPVQLFALGFAVALLATGAVLEWKGRSARLGETRPADQVRPFLEDAATNALRPLARLLAAAALVRVAYCVTRFGFTEDDLSSLVAARLSPDWSFGRTLRLLSTNPLFLIGVALGEPLWWFVAANTAALGAAGACLFALARRAGAGTEEALVALALFVCAPGLPDMFTLPVGIQQLEAMAVVLGTLLLVDRAARELRPLRRVGLVLLAYGLTVTGILVKWPVMVVIPPLAWLWGTRVVGRQSKLGHPAIYLGFIGAIAVQLVIAFPMGGDGDSGLFGTRRVLPNLLGITILLLAMLIGVAIAVRLVVRGSGDVTGDRRGASDRAKGALREAFRPPEVGLSLVALAPFLFNAQFFAPYYATLPAAFFSITAARTLARASVFGPVSRGSTAAAALAVFLGGSVLGIQSPDPRMTTLLTEAHRITIGLRPRRALRLSSRCDDDGQARAAKEELAFVASHANLPDAVRSVTGWTHAQILVGAPERPPASANEDELELRYCGGHLLRADAPQD